MPGGDGTGPLGNGPLTGRGMGPCGYGFGRGYGTGRGLGFGRGFGRGFGWRRGAMPYPIQQPAPDQEKQLLEAELKQLDQDEADLRTERESIKKRLEHLDQ